jgi:hypothetical protein
LAVRYATVTEVRDEEAVPLTGLGNVARHWMNRAAGLAMASPSGRVYARDHSLHESSGLSVLPERGAA